MNNLLVRQESPVFGNDKIIGGELPKITCGGF